MKNITYVSSSNSGYIEFAKIALNNFQNNFSNSDCLYFQCLDTMTYNELSKIKIKDNVHLILDDININNPQSFNTPGFIEITKKKFKFIADILSKSEYLYFFDCDVYFFKDPKEFISPLLDSYEILFQQDAPLTDGHKIGHTYVCSGNFCMVNNQNVSNFLQKIISKFNDRQNEQEIIYEYLKSECLNNNVENYKDVKISILDPNLFQNGFDAFRSNWSQREDKVCIHANHMIGINAKKDAFKKMGLNI